MLFFSTLAIAVAAILIVQVAHRRARRRRVAVTSFWQRSPLVLLAPAALVVVGIALVAAVGASKVVASVFFVAAFATALAWSVRTARS